jgi:hypothetical protein
MEARLAARPAILKQRREIAEHPFGSIKQWMNQGTFLLRGQARENVSQAITSRPSGAGDLSCGARKWTALRDLIPSNATRRSISTRSGTLLR